MKRQMDEDVPVAAPEEASAKRIKQEAAEAEPMPSCPLCAQLVTMGKPSVLAGVQALENPKAKQVGQVPGWRGVFAGDRTGVGRARKRGRRDRGKE